MTKDLLDELCLMLPDQDAALREAFGVLESKVKVATIGAGPEHS